LKEEQKPQIEFPCKYPIKVLGDAGAQLMEHVLQVLNTHAPGITDSDVSSKQSSQGKWQSITVVITATGKPQLEAIFADLKTSARVKMVL
jgi:putative lipoic acid-binding regulatory protein